MTYLEKNGRTILNILGGVVLGKNNIKNTSNNQVD